MTPDRRSPSVGREACQGHELRSVWSSLSADVLRYLHKSPENRAAGDTFKTRLGAFLTPQLLCLLLYRLAHYLYAAGRPRLSRVPTALNFLFHKVRLTPDSCIGPGCFLPHPAGVVFCGRAGEGLTLYSLSVCCPQTPWADGAAGRGPMLGDRVMVGGQSVVLGPIQVGDDVKIGFKVRLGADTPAETIVISRSIRLTRTAATTPSPEALTA